MSDGRVEYCPWCGGDTAKTIEQHGGIGFQANQCEDCETVFRVEVPHRETSIKWTEAR